MTELPARAVRLSRDGAIVTVSIADGIGQALELVRRGQRPTRR